VEQPPGGFVAVGGVPEDGKRRLARGTELQLGRRLVCAWRITERYRAYLPPE